jgi:hypothetical protein
MRTGMLLLRELQGELCQCGSHKFQRQTFCWECYHRLPKTMQNALYKRLSDGYEGAYMTALQFLRGEQCPR